MIVNIIKNIICKFCKQDQSESGNFNLIGEF